MEEAEGSRNSLEMECLIMFVAILRVLYNATERNLLEKVSL